MILDFIPALEFLGRPTEDEDEDLSEFDEVQLEFEDELD
jgi:hypothetical protein